MLSLIIFQYNSASYSKSNFDLDMRPFFPFFSLLFFFFLFFLDSRLSARPVFLSPFRVNASDYGLQSISIRHEKAIQYEDRVIGRPILGTFL